MTIVAPDAADDPNADELLTGNSVKVRCSATKPNVAGARNVNPSSVKIILVNTEKPMNSMAGVVTSLGNDEYEAEFSLLERPNGPIVFECSAADNGEPALVNSSTLETFVDRGPTIEVLEPQDGSGHALKNNLQVRFKVAPAPVSDDDDEADISDMRLEVLGIEFAVTEDPEEAGLFTAEIPFNDPEVFSMPPSSAEILITAKNSRTPEAVERRVELHIDLDGAGPTITVLAPKLLSIVGGEVTLSLMITDPSGVQDDSVTATVKHSTNPIPLNDWTVNGSTYTEVFNTNIPAFKDATQITINIAASDRVGNAATEVSHVLRLDNVAPIISLDSPMMREYNAGDVCSEPFDPLGRDAASDGEIGYDSVLFRIRLQEFVNYVPGQQQDYVSGIKDGSVKLFALQAGGMPLVIDTDDDGFCDEINLAAEPVVNDEFTAVKPGGAAFYKNPYAASDDHPGASFCLNGTELNPPADVCEDAEMFRVIPQALEGGNTPAIYAFNPSNNPNSGACAGEGWQILEPVGGEGWTCVSARTEDNVGNVAVALPIRICLDDSDAPAPGCATQLASPPSCTDGCTPIDFPGNWMQEKP